MAQPETFASPASPPSFLTLPAEIRLTIYELLLVDRSRPYLSIGTEQHDKHVARKRREVEPQRRSTYWVQGGHFRSASVETTYVLRDRPDIHPQILGVNRQIHAEAAHVLYGSYVFDFATDVESVIPFLSDLTLPALHSIRRVNLVKRALPYTREFDRCEWSAACEFLATHLQLQHLGLGVFGGKVDTSMRDNVAQSGLLTTAMGGAADEFKKSDFSEIAQFDGMEWVQQLLAIKGLQHLDIRTIWEVCPPPCSNALAFFVNFSASIENGFAEYLRENMVAGYLPSGNMVAGAA